MWLIGYSIIKQEERQTKLCTKICSAKGMEFIDEIGHNWKCKCLDKFGDIQYFKSS